MVTVPPVAVGYIAGADDDALARQRATVIARARTEGFVLARIVTDRFDAYTISQIASLARQDNAQLVIIPTTSFLTAVRERVTYELAAIRAGCVFADEPDATAAPAPTPRLTGATRRRPARHVARRPS